MTQFVRVAKVADLADPDKMVVEIDDQLVALYHVGGKFYATDDVCTHDGGPLAEGSLEGYAIVCPRHGAKFDIRSGKVLSMPATRDTRSHAVKVEGDDVYVRLAES